MFSMSNVFWGVSSLLVGGVIAWIIAKRVSARSSLIFTLDKQFYIKASDISRKFSISLDGLNLQNLYVAKLRIELRGANDLSDRDISCNNKPMLQFDKLKIFDIRTINNDLSQFEIPIGIVKESKLVINIKHLKRNSHADFYIIATSKNDNEMFTVDFFPGFISGVDVKSAGLINPNWLKHY